MIFPTEYLKYLNKVFPIILIEWKLFHGNSLKNYPHLPKHTIFQWLQQNSYVRCTIFMYHSGKNRPTPLCQNAFLWINFILYLTENALWDLFRWWALYVTLSEVAQLCPTLCDPMDCSLPGSSLHGIFQAIVLEWIAISFSRGSSQSRDRTRVSRIVDRRFTVWATKEGHS